MWLLNFTVFFTVVCKTENTLVLPRRSVENITEYTIISQAKSYSIVHPHFYLDHSVCRKCTKWTVNSCTLWKGIHYWDLFWNTSSSHSHSSFKARSYRQSELRFVRLTGVIFTSKQKRQEGRRFGLRVVGSEPTPVWQRCELCQV